MIRHDGKHSTPSLPVLEPTFDDRLRQLFDESADDEVSDRCLSWLSELMAESPSAETSLVGLERLLRAVPDRRELFRQLLASPRAIEVLLKIFAASPYLTDILLREPALLTQITQPHLLSDVRSRPEFLESALAKIANAQSSEEWSNSLRQFQHGELLRIGVCDFLGLLDLRSITNQLSLLADAIVQAALALIVTHTANSKIDSCSLAPAAGERARVRGPIDATLAAPVGSEPVPPHPRNGGEGEMTSGFAVLALGKLGGEELNYSSDIDLVFVCDGEPACFQEVAQRLTKVLADVTSHGFLYRVDLRLRPWGNAGPVVIPLKTYLDYLQQQAQLWERQALLKARVIAGDFNLGRRFLDLARPLIFGASAEDVRRSVLQAKQRIEADLKRKSKAAGEVKLGAGTIRDIEFVVQCLQLQHGREVPEVRSINTLDGLVRLAELGFVMADEYRELSSAYILFRVIEHALQLKHSRQTHSLPSDPFDLELLARRLDFFHAEQLTTHFQQHRLAVRQIFEKYVGHVTPSPKTESAVPTADASASSSRPAMNGRIRSQIWQQLTDESPLVIDWHPLDAERAEVTIAGFDQLGDLSMMCGLLFVHGFDILEGDVFTEQRYATTEPNKPLKFVNSFVVRSRSGQVFDSRDNSDKSQYSAALHNELLKLLTQARKGRREAQAKLAKRVSDALPTARPSGVGLSPVEITFDNESDPTTTVIRIAADDTSGFLYELTNSLALLGIDIRQMEIRTDAPRVRDTLFVTDDCGRKLLDPRLQHVLRTAVVLIQHFTDLLPQSPDPEAALLHFQELLECELREPDWLERLASLQQPEVLGGLAKLLGVSDVLWEDFLRLQHSSLFPVVTDLPGLHQHKSRAELTAELARKLSSARSFAERRDGLNAFKDREMFRIDMRHVTGVVPEFTAFARELTELAEAVIAAACELAEQEAASRLSERPANQPRSHERSRRGHAAVTRIGKPVYCVAALGKLGGRELGFASDIELLFVFEDASSTEFMERLVELFQQTIHAKRAGIFQIDLRLRPHGRAGNLAVSLDEFTRYFAADGPAWPFERQSLIKLRPIAGDAALGETVLRRRDELLFGSVRWEVAPVRAMRERQARQHVQAGTFHAKLSPGALVDIEYLVQLLQLTHGDQHDSLRVPGTLDALDELSREKVIPCNAAESLRAAYLFFRRLIDALRMARGTADDLTLPQVGSEELIGLARRLNLAEADLVQLAEQHAANVRVWGWSLGWPISPA